MRPRSLLLALPFVLIAPCGAQGATQPAQDAAAAWLQLADTAQYGASWDVAAALFKASMPRAAWESALKSVRPALGAVRSRQLKSATYTRTLPGVPDGEYVVIQYRTRFEHKADALETITPMREGGSWKVSGYFIR
jgi:Protein of unknown function (DUF4019)